MCRLGLFVNVCYPPHFQVRVVSFPSWELFELESEEYRDQILPPAVQARVSVEAASSFGWREWIGAYGFHVGISRFGASAPGPVIYEKYNITPQGVVDAAHKSLAKVQMLSSRNESLDEYDI